MEFGAKMGDQRTIEIFHEALNFGLQLLGAGDLQLTEKQYEVLKSVVIEPWRWPRGSQLWVREC